MPVEATSAADHDKVLVAQRPGPDLHATGIRERQSAAMRESFASDDQSAVIRDGSLRLVWQQQHRGSRSMSSTPLT
jgi:hypothetical protein